MKLPHILAAASIAVAGVAAPAAAQEEAKSVEIPVADLNLSSVEGRDRLMIRVRSAVKRVCRTHSSRDLAQQARENACEESAMRGIEPRLATLLKGHGAQMASRDKQSAAAR